MRKLACAALAVAATFSGTAFANNPNVMSNFNYDYFDARIGMAPLTFGAGFSKSIHPNAHFIATIDLSSRATSTHVPVLASTHQ